MVMRNIVEIDEEKCDGCGLCVPSCAEGAIRIVDGKAKLIADLYCDGLGACLGHCPRDAITVSQREADPFDEAAVAKLLAEKWGAAPAGPPTTCPSTAPQTLGLNIIPPTPAPSSAGDGHARPDASPAALGNWPIQLHLIAPTAEFLRDRDLVLAADCTAFASPDLHRRMMQDRALLIGCPKLDDADFYVKKLAAILVQSQVRSVRVLKMEVPCCTGLVRIAESARSLSGRNIPLEHATVSIRGEISETTEVSANIPMELG